MTIMAAKPSHDRSPSIAPRLRGERRSMQTISAVLPAQLAAAATGSPIRIAAISNGNPEYSGQNAATQNTGAMNNNGLDANEPNISAKNAAAGRIGWENSHSHIGWRRRW